MITVQILGIGVLGPGLLGWKSSKEMLIGRAPFILSAIPPIKSEYLPPNERRRSGVAVKMAVQVALEAVQQAGLKMEQTPSVFASSEGVVPTIHQICEALISRSGAVSPTTFHNSVHNTPSGYWSIAAQSREASNTVVAYDWSFGAGLLEASIQATVERRPVLLVAFDTVLPEPLNSKRPIPYDFSCSLVLSPIQCGSDAPKKSRLIINFDPDNKREIQPFSLHKALEELYLNNPAAKSLPLLKALAYEKPTSVVVELPSGFIEVRVEPC
jgi:hypothetical protein